MRVKISGGATSQFGELWHVSPRDLVKRVVVEALKEAELSHKQINAIFVANMLSSSLGGQDHLGSFFAEELGLPVCAMKVEGACASGGLAMHAGVLGILSGHYEHVLVVGVEKMTDHAPSEVAQALMGAGSDSERQAGATFPALYALLARVHMEHYGTTETDLAYVAVKNHFHATLNPLSQFPFPVTVENVLASSSIADPLKLLDCSPITDGAAAVILSEDKQSASSADGQRTNNKKTVAIIASSVATDTLGLAERDNLTALKATQEAAQKAYTETGIGPKDVDVAEVHDCFSIAEILAMEDLGFVKKGEGGIVLREGKTRLGNPLVVNTSGGLKACGHPVGATGVKQVVEVYQQLMGRCGKRQVEKARIGLTHNVGGSGGTAVIHILQSFV